MLKKTVVMLLVLTLALTALSFSVSALTSIEKAQSIVNDANVKIAQEVLKAQATTKDDVDKLLNKTNAIAEKAIEKSERLGVTVTCEYDFYTVDGMQVCIDPLKVAY